MSATEPIPASELEDDWPFDMSNLYPRETGLPMTIWAGPKGGARHDARIKVCMAHGDRMDVDNLATVALRPEPHIRHGALAKSDLDLVVRWIALNRDALLDHWEGKLGGIEFAKALKPL